MEWTIASSPPPTSSADVSNASVAEMGNSSLARSISWAVVSALLFDGSSESGSTESLGVVTSPGSSAWVGEDPVGVSKSLSPPHAARVRAREPAMLSVLKPFNKMNGLFQYCHVLKMDHNLSI